MNASYRIVFNVRTGKIATNFPVSSSAHGVFVVPQFHRVCASATDEHQALAVDTSTLIIIGRASPIDYPDGIACAPGPRRFFVSEEHGGVDAVIDTRTHRLITKFPLRGGPGNTVYGLPPATHLSLSIISTNSSPSTRHAPPSFIASAFPVSLIPT